MKRLQDPDNLLPENRRAECETKICGALANMLSPTTTHAGSPLLYSWAVGRPHILDEHYPAATDGINYYWRPSLLEWASPRAVSVVLAHETYHIFLLHFRKGGLAPRIQGYAADFVVNSFIAREARERDVEGIFGDFPVLGAKHLVEAARGIKPPPGPAHILYDPAFYGKSLAEIYAILRERLPDGMESPIEVDSHRPVLYSVPQLERQVAQARHLADRTSAGTKPGAMEEVVSGIGRPTMSLNEAVQSCRVGKGERDHKKSHRRFRKRYLGLRPPLYVPKNRRRAREALVLVDTSGSMSHAAIRSGAALLRTLKGWDLMVLCGDTAPDWESPLRVRAEQLTELTARGRAGTIINPFFREYRAKAGDDFDCLIVVTDGGFPPLSPRARPPLPVVWVITGEAEFDPPFGRVVRAPDLPRAA